MDSNSPLSPACHPPATRLRLRITAAAEAKLRHGHPWLFADSIREQNRPGQLGELAVIYDRQDRFLAIGAFEPQSPIRVRILQANQPQTLDAAWWSARLEQALLKRQSLLALDPGSRTTPASGLPTSGWRWLNGESDGWPGLVLDRYDRTLVLKLYSGIWLPTLMDSVALFERRLQPQRIVLRLSRNLQSFAQTSGRLDGQLLAGPPLDAPVVFLENGLRFEADVLRGQKTGFFLDQRDNRRRVAELAAGRTVLNAFSFSGAFSLYAARAGAQAITDLDLSPHALAAAARNFALNQAHPAVRACPQERLQAEAFAWLAANPRRHFDLIILDPPSLAKREAEKPGALRAYAKLASLAVARLRPRGVLVSCSCSAHVTASEFFMSVREAVTRSGRSFDELARTEHALDHPAAFPEVHYLKALFLKIH